MTSPASEPVAQLWEATVFAPVPALNPFEVTVERLAHAIRLGMLPVGAPLPPERELAERLGISRVTLRQAIATLRGTGLLASRRGRGGGTFVVADAPGRRRRPPVQIRRAMGDDLADALTFRGVVEPGAAALAAARSLHPEEEETLRRGLAEATGAADDVRRAADSRLHLTIAALCGSASVAAAVADVQLRLDELLRAIPVIPHNIVHSHRQHEKVVSAVLAGDPERAGTAMREHVDGTAALLTGLLG